ncbi:hypothetical protein F8388_016802 [Cannabis sativa]|uniref:DUF1985 domain-containing protein n=1 Tax=Cannabis sativa TaxID=3483 RepID=A0A7J6ERE4_CANSA|nr:hypothetical protein F8388_016802 [Cannabis sativa]
METNSNLSLSTVNFDANKFTFVDSNIHISSHWHGFDCIRSFLSAPQLQKLRGSCFGFLLDLDKSLKPSNMIIHSLLLHQECNSNINELQLSFGHHKAKFGIAEFGFITGLNCNEFPPDFDVIDCPTNRLLNKYFPNKEFIKRNELAEFLMKTNIDDDDDAVKLTKVFIVQNILESKRGDRYIDNFVLRLVDDEQLFENYPWGRRSFNATIGNLSTAVNCRKTGYELCGFPLAFQVWGFEVLPKLGSLFATKVGSSIPKILNWKLTKTARLHTIWRKVFKDPTVVYAPLALFNARRTPPDFSSPTMNNDEDIDLMKENGEIKKENAEMRKEHGELRKKIDELNHKITELSGLKTDFEKIKDLVMSLVDKDVVKKETCGEGEKDKHNNLLSGEIVPHSPVILQLNKNEKNEEIKMSFLNSTDRLLRISGTSISMSSSSVIELTDVGSFSCAFEGRGVSLLVLLRKIPQKNCFDSEDKISGKIHGKGNFVYRHIKTIANKQSYYHNKTSDIEKEERSQREEGNSSRDFEGVLLQFRSFTQREIEDRIPRKEIKTSSSKLIKTIKTTTTNANHREALRTSNDSTASQYEKFKDKLPTSKLHLEQEKICETENFPFLNAPVTASSFFTVSIKVE